MKKWLMAVIFGTILVLGACGGDNSDEPAVNGGETETTDASEAADIFKENCATCHGDDLSGAAGPNLTEVGNRLDQDQIEEVIEDGKGAMPGELLSGQDIPAVAEWLAEMK